jgi:hypothetical protein
MRVAEATKMTLEDDPHECGMGYDIYSKNLKRGQSIGRTYRIYYIVLIPATQEHPEFVHSPSQPVELWNIDEQMNKYHSSDRYVAIDTREAIESYLNYVVCLFRRRRSYPYSVEDLGGNCVIVDIVPTNEPPVLISSYNQSRDNILHVLRDAIIDW